MREWFINVAVTFDGRIALENQMVNISSDEDWKVVHSIRNRIAAIGVGSNTVIVDNPTLLTRREFLPVDQEIHHPIRLLFDRSGRIPKSASVFVDQDQATTLWITLTKDEIKNIEKIKASDVFTAFDLINLWLDEKGIEGDVLIEGGSRLIDSFLNSGIIKRIRIYRSPISLPNGIALFSKKSNYRLSLERVKKLGPGIEEWYTIDLNKFYNK